jgi:hypothetical protein
MHKVNKQFIETSLCMLLDSKTDKILKTINFEALYDSIYAGYSIEERMKAHDGK